jgi:hypothetical protein
MLKIRHRSFLRHHILTFKKLKFKKKSFKNKISYSTSFVEQVLFTEISLFAVLTGENSLFS